jgi:hypothetical protein
LLSSVVLANLGGLINTYLNGINKLEAVLAIAAVRSGLGLGLGALLLPGVGSIGLGVAILAGEFLGTLVLGYCFFQHEIIQLGGRLSWGAIWPATISTVSVMLYLLFQSAGGGWTVVLQLLSFAGVIFGAWSGWKHLDRDTQNRLMRLAKLKHS